MPSYPNIDPTSRDVCLWLAADWVPTVPQNFDNVGNAMATLFELMSTEGWLTIMYAGVDARGIEMQPQRDHSPLWQLYFIVYMVLGSQLVINLFVGELHRIWPIRMWACTLQYFNRLQLLSLYPLRRQYIAIAIHSCRCNNYCHIHRLFVLSAVPTARRCCHRCFQPIEAGAGRKWEFDGVAERVGRDSGSHAADPTQANPTAAARPD